ncbi:hypothetical protein SASPL_141697 [Salvia splendens]|uniref:PARP-type domain-containing protein n=1 Tax=Salvia splendens TaxID=180675 RepID=A0A8X8WK94_SALSN|nr:hypothetical protein SASPL_141697 [Salvia splendens]
MSPSSPSTASVKLVAEYAKSGRSSCKKCSKSIAASALRFGFVSKDPRGFDMTKWHHLNCVSFSASGFASSVDAITGFSSLKSSDQEAVKKLVIEGAQAVEASKVDEDDDEPDQGKSKKPKVEICLGRLVNLCMLRIYMVLNQLVLLLLTSEEGTKLQLEIAVSASDIKEKYKDSTLLPKWKAFQTVIFLERDDGLHDSSKIAAFDFDGCLAKTSVKRIGVEWNIFDLCVIVGADAWSLMYPSIPEKLQNLYSVGYKLVIFTNESNIERWKNKRQAAVDSKIGRLNSFIELVKVPIQVFIACGVSSSQSEDPFRKPKPGMWKIMEKEFNSSLPIDMEQSFYVGDAAGRAGDHSDADKKFAQAVGLKFYVPEDYFVTD